MEELQRHVRNQLRVLTDTASSAGGDASTWFSNGSTKKPFPSSKEPDLVRVKGWVTDWKLKEDQGMIGPEVVQWLDTLEGCCKHSESWKFADMKRTREMVGKRSFHYEINIFCQRDVGEPTVSLKDACWKVRAMISTRNDADDALHVNKKRRSK